MQSAGNLFPGAPCENSPIPPHPDLSRCLASWHVQRFLSMKNNLSGQPEVPPTTAAMLKHVSELIGMSLEATDGKVGKVKDLLLDERWWTVRYIVADTGGWLNENKVLVSPRMIIDSAGSMAEGTLYVRASKSVIEACPPLDQDAPVTRRYELEHARHFRHSPYWLGAEVWGLGALPELLPPAPDEMFRHEEAMDDIDRCHLFSASEMLGYEVEHANGQVEGKVDDFVLACRPWLMRWLVIDLGGWFDKEPICIPPSSIRRIDWEAKRLILSTTVCAPVPDPDPVDPADIGLMGVPATQF